MRPDLPPPFSRYWLDLVLSPTPVDPADVVLVRPWPVETSRPAEARPVDQEWDTVAMGAGQPLAVRAPSAAERSCCVFTLGAPSVEVTVHRRGTAGGGAGRRREQGEERARSKKRPAGARRSPLASPSWSRAIRSARSRVRHRWPSRSTSSSSGLRAPRHDRGRRPGRRPREPASVPARGRSSCSSPRWRHGHSQALDRDPGARRGADDRPGFVVVQAELRTAGVEGEIGDRRQLRGTGRRSWRWRPGRAVLRVPKRGLGRAYIDALPWMRAATGCCFGDCDCTYDFRLLEGFVAKFRDGLRVRDGLALGKGSIEKGAMPPSAPVPPARR